MNVTRYLERYWSTEYDCWSLVREFYEVEFGVVLPVVSVEALDLRAVVREFRHSEVRTRFEKIDVPVDGCVVEMGHRGVPQHIGIYVDGRILHCHYRGGVVIEPKPPFEILNYYALCSSPT